MNLVVITSGFLPIPATKGGAVENLVVNLLNENEISKKIKFTILSIYDPDAVNASQRYKYSNFQFIKVNKVVQSIDRVIFFVANNILKKKNSHSYRYITQRIFYLRKCSKIINKNNYDKVLLENHPSQYLALKWKKNFKKYEDNYYYHCHNEINSSYGCYEIIKKTKKIICVSSFRKDTVKKFWKLEEDKFIVLKNSIDSKKVAKKATEKELIELRKKLNISNKDKILIYTGRIVPGKGVEELIKAAKLTKSNQYKILILGSSLNLLNVKNEFEKEVSALIDSKIKNRIIFTGFIKYEELYKYYSLADVAIMPSVIEDSAPLSVIESLCCGIPIITTDSGGIPEYATEGSSIILKRDKDLILNIAKSIDNLLENRDIITKMSINCIKVSKKNTMKQFYVDFLKCIK